MSQNKVSILCTMPIDKSLMDEMDQQGFEIEILSFIETIPNQSEEINQKIQTTLSQQSAVVFTSKNAVEIIAEKLNHPLPNWNIYCINSNTQQIVKKHFGDDSVVGVAPDAASLAKLIVKENKYNSVIFFCGNKRRDELPSILKENNIAVEEIAVYETNLLEHEVTKKYEGILFFSPSAVNSFFNHNKPDATTVLFSIGNTTSNEIKKYTDNLIITSDIPSKQFLFNKTIEYFNKK